MLGHGNSKTMTQKSQQGPLQRISSLGALGEGSSWDLRIRPAAAAAPATVSGNLGTWKSGNLEFWEFGDLGTWKSRNLEIWGHGNPKCWVPKKTKNTIFWIGGEKKHVQGPFGGHLRPFFTDWKNPKTCKN